MYWFDRHPSAAPQQWSGLGLVIERRGRATLRVEGTAPGLMRVCIGHAPVLWARLGSAWSGFWWLRGDHRSLLPPLKAATARAVAGPPDHARWLAAWARIYARHLADALDGGAWAMEPARGPGLRAFDDVTTSLPPTRGLHTLSDQPSRGFESWGLNGSGGIIGLRAQSPPDAARVKALRKRARNGELAPLLLFYVGGLDACLLIDGHDRLNAALLEDRPPAALVLSRIRRVRYAADPEKQAALWRSVGQAFDRYGGSHRSVVDRLNRHLVAGFAEPVFEIGRTRAWALPGGAARWRAEVAARAPEWDGLG